MFVSELVKRLCTNPELISFVNQNRKKLDWMAKMMSAVPDDEVLTRNTLRAFLLYVDKFKRLPPTIKALREFVYVNPDKNNMLAQRSAGIDDELERLTEYEPDPEEIKAMDITAVLQFAFDEVRNLWHSENYQNAISITMGIMHLGEDKTEAGPNVAMQWLRGEWVKDFRDEAPVVAGLLHENTAVVQQEFFDLYTNPDTQGRFPLGFPHIDECVVVGKENLRFIGIAGMSGDGKTSLTNCIVYNWLRQGAHILYVSTEHSPTEIWEAMTFMHQTDPDYDFTLPSRQQWEQQKISPEEFTNFNRVLRDIRERKNLPGLLDVQAFRDWQTIVDHLTQNHKKHRYDAVVIDYIARLDTPGDAKFRDAQIKAIIHEAQKLTREFDECRGLILLTPIQVNREAHKAALKAEEGEARYNINALAQFSEYQHDMDLILSVWSDDDMKTSGDMEIQCLKKRKGRQPPRDFLRIDPTSGLINYKVPPTIQKVWAETKDDVEPEGINPDKWDNVSY